MVSSPILLLFVACGGGPALDWVEPTQVPAGEQLTLHGKNLAHLQVTALLRDAGGHLFALDQAMVTDRSVSAHVPLLTAPGPYDVVVTDGHATVTLDDALTVERPTQEVPCSGAYTANTQLSLARQTIVIDRFHRNGERETLRIPIGDVERIEYTKTTTDKVFCSAIFLVQKTGVRVLFDDDTALDLQDRAQKMAKDLGKPLEKTVP